MPTRASFCCTSGVANDREGCVADGKERERSEESLLRRLVVTVLRAIERRSDLAILASDSCALEVANGSSRVRLDPVRRPLPFFASPVTPRPLRPNTRANTLAKPGVPF